MNITTVASNPVWKNVAANVELTETHVKEALALYPATDIVLFPELSLSGFVVDEDVNTVAQPIDGPGVRAVQAMAQQYNVAIIAGIIEQIPGEKPANTQFVASPAGGLLAVYRKNHLFTQSAEPKLYCRGQELTTFEYKGWKCGVSICFDIRFPRLFESYKKAGVECIFSGFNWVEGRNKPAIMEHLVLARAHENQLFFAAVDRNGENAGVSFYGTSVIASPYAENLAAHTGIFSNASINKDDIATLGAKLPLAESFKETYSIK
jgi:predicted amidohydrolase